ncbi:hypothetical protein LOAG_14311 [Loa loa]|uniref:Uncharacterized protein n=1 Tax=Loa loa TaxID=7209 RepID=A0A1S0TIX3_LOALO|nr:hypothetical protein LOAG_14311 [Loa loa]EFO14213.1 hypothetical protein LOAG_14311 [Loa loa]
MCLSFIGQFIFSILMVITLALTTLSMFLPGLKELQEVAANVSKDLKHFKIPKEFISLESLCRIASSDNAAFNNETNSADFCKQWFNVTIRRLGKDSGDIDVLISDY